MIDRSSNYRRFVGSPLRWAVQERVCLRESKRGSELVKPDAERRVRAGKLPAWEKVELPAPPELNFRSVLRAIGPGAILLSISVGSGEWLVGPAAISRYGPSLLWIATIAIFLQVVLNMEFIRYTMFTGEPILTGFMRTRPGPGFWGWFYTVCAWLQMGWPGWALASETAITAAFLGRLPGPEDRPTVIFLGYVTFFVCVAILAVGERVERTLEKVSWFSGALDPGLPPDGGSHLRLSGELDPDGEGLCQLRIPPLWGGLALAGRLCCLLGSRGLDQFRGLQLDSG